MAALRDELDAAALRGLAGAAAALLGDDGEAVCVALARRDRAARPGLPWLAGPCFSALAPLGVVAPDEADAWVVTRFLVGAEHRAATAAAAADACRSLARRRSRGWGAPAGEPEADASRALWQRTLAGAVDDAFARVAEGYAGVRAAVLADDDEQVRAVAERVAAPIRVAAARVEELAVFVARSQPESAGTPVTVTGPDVPALRPPPPTPWRRPRAEPVVPRARPDPVWPAVVFVVAALALAAGLLWLVVEGRLPGFAA